MTGAASVSSPSLSDRSDICAGRLSAGDHALHFADASPILTPAQAAPVAIG